MPLSRRQFVRIVPALGPFVVAAPKLARAQASGEPSWPLPPPSGGAPVDESFPSHHPYTVMEIVRVSHFDPARVKELLQKQPALAKASWDWGYGDWETALGAASHVGQRPIAQMLLEHGAPPTLFSAAMLGQVDIVKAWLAAVPEALHVRGPHGIPLIAHAQAGGPPSAPVVEFLRTLGPERPLPTQPLTAEERASVEGQYSFGDRARDLFTVDTKQDQLGIVRVGAMRRTLSHLGGLEFRPQGAPQVKIRFERTDGKVTALGVFDPDLVVRATKRSGTA